MQSIASTLLCPVPLGTCQPKAGHSVSYIIILKYGISSPKINIGIGTNTVEIYKYHV